MKKPGPDNGPESRNHAGLLQHLRHSIAKPFVRYSIWGAVLIGGAGAIAGCDSPIALKLKPKLDVSNYQEMGKTTLGMGKTMAIGSTILRLDGSAGSPPREALITLLDSRGRVIDLPVWRAGDGSYLDEPNWPGRYAVKLESVGLDAQGQPQAVFSAYQMQ